MFADFAEKEYRQLKGLAVALTDLSHLFATGHPFVPLYCHKIRVGGEV
jgi:hypothetical protein